MLAVSVVVCTSSMLLGAYASFFLDSAPAPTIILILTAIFVVAFVVSSLRMRRVTRAI
jgi:manganese/iron transport system permease protein